jgi:hypothetical protein
MVPPLIFNTAPSQRRRDTPRGPEVSLSGSRPPPADQWHSLRSCVCEPEPGSGVRFRYRRSPNPKPNPKPAVACASAPPVSEPEAEPEPGGGVCFRYRRSFSLPSSCGGGASLGGDLCKSALRVSGCSLAGRQAKLLLASTHWPWPSVSCRGRFSRPPSQDAGHFFSPACIFMKRQSGGGLLWRIV